MTALAPTPDSSRPSGALAGRLRRLQLPRAAAFWLAAGVFFLLMAAAAAPTPLYRVYQAQWRFSPTTLTAVFAVYVLVLLATILIFGSLSDHVGRRPMIVAGLAVNAAACVLFLLAGGVGQLFVARALQGVAVGLTASAIGAALLDLRPAGGLAPMVTSTAPTAGLAVGALGTSALVQYAPAPTRLVWWLLLGACLAVIIFGLAMPEPGTVRPGALASLRPHVSVPRPARGTFVKALPCMVAVWALGGFYLSLGPSLAAQLSRSPNRLWGGVVTFLLFGLGAVTSLAFRNSSPRAVMVGGCLALLAGALLTVAAVVASTPAVLLLGTAVAGVGFGAAWLGAYRTLVALAGPADRAGLVAAIFVVSYLALGVPALMAGVATSRVGLRETALVYSVVIAVLAAAAAGSFLVGGRARTGAPRAVAAPPVPPPGPCTVPPSMQAALAALIFGLSNGQQHGFATPATVLALSAALLLAAGFLRVEVTAAAPMLPLQLFAAPQRRAAVAAMVMLGAVLAGHVYLVSLYLQKVLQFSPLRTATALVPATLTVVAMSTLGTRRLLSRLPAWQVLLAGLACVAAGQLWLAQVSPGATYPAVILPGLLLTSLGMGLALPTSSIAITSGVRREDQGLAGALFTTSQQIGAAIGLAVLATAAAARTTQAGGSLVAGYRLSFLISTGITALAGVVVAVQLHPRRQRDPRLHQPSPHGTPAVSLVECQLRRC